MDLFGVGEFISYVYHFKLTEYNFRTKLNHFFSEHRRMELTSWISAALRFADKHYLGRKPWFPCSFHPQLCFGPSTAERRRGKSCFAFKDPAEIMNGLKAQLKTDFFDALVGRQ